MSSICGLTNLGNTCYINACIQILNNTPEWNNLLNTPKYINKKNKNKIIIGEWNDLSALMMIEHNNEISPNRFIYYVFEIAKNNNRNLFINGSENDMSEFLIFIIETVHQIMSRKVKASIKGKILNDLDKIALKCYEVMKTLYEKEYSEIITMFYGITYSIIRSSNGCVIHSVKPEPFLILDLPIPPSATNLEHCIFAYIQPEKLYNENAWFNETTNQKEDVVKQLYFWSFPNILIITLKRFTYQNKKLIEFPLNNLNLTQFIGGYQITQTDYIYDLYAVSNHYGGLNYGGHYTAIININNNWVEFDDKNTTIVPKMRVVSANAYCLFYRKRNL